MVAQYPIARVKDSRRHSNAMKPLFFIRWSRREIPARCRTATSAALLFLSAVSLWAGEPAPATSDFEANIQRVFAVDQQADVRVTFGYDNWTDYKDPNDPGRARNFMSWLASRSFVQIICTESMATELGVPQDAQNLRMFQGPGQAGQTIRVALIWSAYSSSTAKNIGAGYARQLVCSYQALKFMQKSAADSDVMVYVGHSRGGGGPDTFPPQTMARTAEDRQRVDFSYYRRERPGLAALSSSFSKNRYGPHFILWTGCLSENFSDWFSDRLAGRTCPVSLVLSTRLTRQKPWQDGIEGSDEALMVVLRLTEALQQHQSAAEFQKHLLTCEIDELRNPERPEWKLLSLPHVRTVRQPVESKVSQVSDSRHP